MNKYVPGAYICPACKFNLTVTVMHLDGNMSALKSNEVQRCPNDGRVMDRLTWERHARDMEEAFEKLLARSRFTTEKPTEPGWYWARNHTDEKGVFWEAVVRVDKGDDGTLFATWLTAPGFADLKKKSQWSDGCLWQGPLTPPTF